MSFQILTLMGWTEVKHHEFPFGRRMRSPPAMQRWHWTGSRAPDWKGEEVKFWLPTECDLGEGNGILGVPVFSSGSSMKVIGA